MQSVYIVIVDALKTITIEKNKKINRLCGIGVFVVANLRRAVFGYLKASMVGANPTLHIKILHRLLQKSLLATVIKRMPALGIEP